jgi:uncharacterized protein (TIGR02646 family)
MRNLTFIFEDTEVKQEFQQFIVKQKVITNNTYLLTKYNKKEIIVTADFISHWSDLKPILWDKQGKRCAICEKILQDRANSHVEHYRPKVEYWWLAYVPENYYVACAECNSYAKGTQFPFAVGSLQVNYATKDRIEEEIPLLINPLIENPYQYFKVVFGSHSKTNKNIIMLEPLESLDRNSVAYQKAIETIKVFNINLANYEHDKQYMQIEVNIEFHQQLYELAQKSLNGENDLQECFHKLDSQYKNLGYTAMLMAGNVDIL